MVRLKKTAKFPNERQPSYTRWWISWGIGLTLFFSQLAIAQNYTSTKLPLFAGTEDVLIRDVTLDNLGFIWYLAGGEVYRYDGFRSLDILQTLSDQQVVDDIPQRIFADKSNRLWMAGHVHLSYLDLTTWKVHPVESASLPHIQDRTISSITQMEDSTLLFIYESGQLLLLKNEDFIRLDDLKQHSLHAQTKVIPQSVQTWEGKYWVGTSAGTLLSIDPTRQYQTAYHQLDGIKHPILTILKDQNGLILNVFPNKFFKWNGTELAPFKPAEFIPSAQDFYVVGAGSQFNMYADSKSAYVLDHDLNVIQQVAMPLENEFGPKHILMNGDEAILGTEEGIVVIYPQTKGLSHLIPPNTSVNKSVRGIYVYPDGAYFYSTYQGAGLVESDGSVHRLEQLRHAYVVYPLSQNKLMVGTEGGFVKIFDRQTKQIEELPYSLQHSSSASPPNDLPLHVMSISESDTDYLIGSSHGLWLLDKNHYALKRAPNQTGLSHSLRLHIRHILPTEEGAYVLSTNQGVYQWKEGEWTKRYPTQSNLGVYKTLLLGDTLWIATQGKGLIALDKSNQEIANLATLDGLSNNLVYSLENADGTLVAGTARGLNLIRNGHIRIIHRAEGLAQSEFNASASFWDPLHKKMYVGGLNGYTVLDMAEDWFAPAEPLTSHVTEIYTTSSKTGQRKADYSWSYRGAQHLTLEAGESLAGLYVGLPGNYRAQGQIRISMNTGDGPLLDNGQFISLLEPSPGDYKLGVETTNRGMLVHHNELIIHKLPFFYQTWWFQALLFGLALLLLFMWYRNRIIKIRDEQAIRNRIASDLHDEVGSLLTRIFFQVNLMGTRKSEEEKTRKQLEAIADTSQQALSTMSDMVWSIDSQYDRMHDLVIRMKDYAFRLREEVDFRYKFEASEGVMPGKLSQEVRQNLFLIFKEGLTNAIKYGDGSEIHIAFNVEPLIRLRITNACRDLGQDTGIRQGGQGLEIMERRARKIGATLQVFNKNGLFALQVELLPKRGIGAVTGKL